MNNFKTQESRDELLEKIRNQHVILQSEMELSAGRNLFEAAINNYEALNMDDCTDALDCINRAAKLAFEKDTELEAKCEAFTGKIFYKGLVNIQKAKKHLTDCIRLSVTLLPKDVSGEPWH